MIFELLTDLAVNKIKKEVVEKVAKTAVAKTAVKATEKLSTDEIARNIIKRGMEKVAELTKTVKDGDTVYRQEVRLADVKNAIKKLDTKTRYTKKELKKLENMFNVNRLKANTYQYIDLPVERVVTGDSIIDQPFKQTFTIGTVSESALTKVQNMGKELNKMLKAYNDISEGSKEQLMRTLSKLPDNLIKDSMDLSKGIDISRLKEKDVKELIEALQQASEIADLPRNTNARQAIAQWEEDLSGGIKSDDFDGGFSDGRYNLPLSYVEIKEELDRMYSRLNYEDSEEKHTNIAFYEWRRETYDGDIDQSVKRKVANELFQLIKTNVKPDPNYRGMREHSEYKAGDPIMPELINAKMLELQRG